MQDDQFPLRCLPADVMKNVLRTMDRDQLFSYSLISRATKRNVMDLKMKLRFFGIFIDSKLQLTVTILPDNYRIQLTFDRNRTVKWNPAENEPLVLDTPRIVEVKCSKDYGEAFTGNTVMENSRMTVREYILHLFDIFHHPLITSIRFAEGSDRFDNRFIRRMVEGLTVNRTIFHQLSLDICYHHLMIRTTIHPKTVLLNSDLEPVESLQKLVIQNTEDVVFHSKLFTPEDSIPFRLDDVLINSSENIHMYCTVSSDTDLNRFLKLWMKGSNPRLKYMEVGWTLGPEKDQLVIMNGIRHRVMEEDERRERPYPMKIEKRTVVASEGAFVIRRYNGVEATVSFQRPQFMELAVWD
ncbi:hypothetical protein CAEBREN_16036 [Caenorhabditis brenneri]|uniref:F-box domain-containing protein n=1 Tax=Caenorhabditis brenneri TaxID=135651 RepID=G0N3I4_CAEBE|nr:hypothetical protein CAEBREN_16036 [Caenorhabditis brenneri]